MYSDERRIDTVIEEAEMLVANEDYEGALEKIKTALVTYPKSENLLAKENEYKKMLSVQIKEKTLEEAEDLAEIGDYKSAIVLIKNAQDTYGDDVDYTSAYNSYCESYKAKAISAADELSNNGDYIGAIRKIDEIKTIVSEDTQMAKKLQEYGEAYVSDVIVQVDALIIANDYNSAEHLLNDAVTIFPDNQLLKDEQTKLNRSAHIEYLFDTEPYLVENARLYMRNNDEDTTYSKPVSFVTDAMYYDSGWNMQSAGKTYYKGMSITPDSNTQTKIYYNLDCLYSRLMGKVAFEDKYSERIDKSYTINFYADDNFVKSYTFQKGNLPIDIDVDLNYCTKFVIELVRPANDESQFPNINLIEFGLKY
jgi:hypothetical protein